MEGSETRPATLLMDQMMPQLLLPPVEKEDDVAKQVAQSTRN